MVSNIDELSDSVIKWANDLIKLTGGNAMVFLAIGVFAVFCHVLLDRQWYKGRGGFFINTFSLLAYIMVFVSFGFAAYLYVYPYYAA